MRIDPRVRLELGSTRWSLRFLGLVVLLISMFAVPGVYEDYKENWDCPSWPHVEGVITDHHFYDVPNDKFEVIGQSIYITYRYSVDKKTFKGERVAPFDDNVYKFGEPQRLTEKYPIGSKHVVYYRPDSPGKSFLEPTPARYGSVALLIVLIFPMVGLALCLMSFPPDEKTKQGNKLRYMGIVIAVIAAVIVFSAFLFAKLTIVASIDKWGFPLCMALAFFGHAVAVVGLCSWFVGIVVHEIERQKQFWKRFARKDARRVDLSK